jgi:ABC-type multidrug transport system fused ATPase/permease subunit
MAVSAKIPETTVKHVARKEVFSLAGFFAVYRTLITQRPRLLVAAIFLSFAAAIAEGLGLAIIYPMLDSVVGAGKLQGPVWDVLRGIAMRISGTSVTEGLLILAIVIFFLKAILLALNTVTTTLWINRLQEDWRLAALSHYLYGPYVTIVGERRGKIIQNILGETGTASKGVEQLLVLLTKSIFAVALIGTLFLLNWKMTAGLLAVVAFIAIAVRPYALQPMQRLGRKRMGSKQAMMAVTSEPIYCASTIKLLGVEDEVLERLKRPQRKQTRVNVLMAVFSKAPTFFVEFVVILTVAIVFIVLARGYGVPYQEAAPLIGAFAIVCSRLLNVLSSLFNMRLNLATIAPSLPLVQRLVNTNGMAKSVRRGVKLEKVESHIEFRNVSFGYVDGKQIFSNLSLRFPKGKMIGIVGPTGAGKSTIGHLLGRLFDPTAGSITINGRDIQEFSLHSLRRRIGFVEQTPAIFHGSIAENIKLGAPEASFEDIQEAARAAGLHDFILGLPQGYDTIVHDQGSTLSGGERQRLAIARAIARRPDIYIFDEGTSALDVRTEAAVQKSIQSLSGDATVIAIAHRISTLKSADLIYEVSPGGKVVPRRFDEIAA